MAPESCGIFHDTETFSVEVEDGSWFQYSSATEVP